MPLATLALPAGTFRNGTRYTARGRWYDAQLVRFQGRAIKPVGGWQALQTDGEDVRFPSSVVLTLTGNPGDAETVTLAGKVYTFQTTLTDSDGNVLIGATASDSIDNLVAAITLGAGAGTAYAAATTYHPTIHAYAGDGDTLVVTAKQANLYLAVEDFSDGAWTANNLDSVSTDQDEAPDGTVTMDRLIENTSNSNHGIRQDISITAGARVAQSIWVRKDSTRQWVRVMQEGSGGTDRVQAWFDVQNGVVGMNNATGTGTLTATAIEEDGDSYRLTVVGAIGGSHTTALTHFNFAPTDGGTTYTGDGTSYISVWGAQAVEVPTTETTATDYMASGSTHAFRADDRILSVATDVTGASFTATETVPNRVRALLAWTENTGNLARLAIGANGRIWTYAQGTLTDRTPEGLVPGGVDTTLSSGGYGVGDYGEGPYGVGDTSIATVTRAASWQFDTFGEQLVAVLAPSDGTLYLWDGVTTYLEPLSGSPPSDNNAVVVTPERFVVALGADGDPRKVRWADQESLTTWTPSSTNQAGSFILPGVGAILCGRRGRNETLLFTENDLFAMEYIGGTLVYAFRPLGTACGVVGPHAVAIVDGKAVWMGQRSFFLYDGYVRSLDSDLDDDVFRDFNRNQRAKCWAMPLAAFGEVWFFYPSATSQEPNRFVVWNYRENHWTNGRLDRLAGFDAGAWEFPVMASATRVFDHERGTDRDDAVTPYLDSGPIELDGGERVMHVRQLYPDEAVGSTQGLGSLQLRIFSAFYPTATEAEHGPFTLANPTPVRIAGRQVRLRFEEVTAGDWRLGVPRLDMVPGGRR